MSHKEYFYGTLFYQLGIPVVVMDGDLETVVDANQSALRYLSVEASDLLGRDMKSSLRKVLCGTTADRIEEKDLGERVENLDPGIDMEVLGDFCFKGRKYVVSMLIESGIKNRHG